MRFFAMVSTICLCMLASIFTVSSVNAAEKEDAPAFFFRDKAGKEHKLSDYEGKKVVVVDFWATWCGPCKRALPGFKSLADEFKGKDVEFIAMNVGEPTQNVLNYLNAVGLSKLNVRFDPRSTAWKIFDIKGIPHCVVIDVDGKIVLRTHPASKDDIRKAVNAELSRNSDK